MIEAEKADKLQAQIDGMEHEIKGIMREEKEEKQFAAAEMQVRKGENMIEHEAEIKGRPKRTWFETEHDKKKAKEAGKVELNGASQSSKKKALGKMSNKVQKRLDNKAERADGMGWRKGKADALNAKTKHSQKGGPKGKKGKAGGRK